MKALPSAGNYPNADQTLPFCLRIETAQKNSPPGQATLVMVLKVSRLCNNSRLERRSVSVARTEVEGSDHSIQISGIPLNRRKPGLLPKRL
jgi:hypothetical protein